MTGLAGELFTREINGISIMPPIFPEHKHPHAGPGIASASPQRGGIRMAAVVLACLAALAACKRRETYGPSPLDGTCAVLRYRDGRATVTSCDWRGWNWLCAIDDDGASSCERRDPLPPETARP